MEMVGRGDRADLLTHPLAQFRFEIAVRLLARVQSHVAIDPLPLDIVRIADDGGFGHFGMQDQRALDLGGAHAVARDVDDIVHPPRDPVIAVFIAAASVAGEIFARIGAEIGLHETVVIAIDGARLAGPAPRDAEIPLGLALQNHTVVLDQFGHDPEKGLARAARLHVVRTGKRGDHDPARLGLPPGVDDRRFAAADMIVIPAPGFGIDRLAHTTEQAERREIVLRDMARPFAHQGADRGGGGVEDVDPMLLAHRPEPVVIGVIRHPFEHQRGRPVQERTVNDIAVPGDPADIGGAPIDLARPVIEDVAESRLGPDGITAGRVQHPLWLAGGTAGIKDEERVFGVHRLAGTAVGNALRQFVIPVIAPLAHRDIAAGMAQHQNRLHRNFFERLVDIGLQWDPLTAAQALVGGDDPVALAVLDPSRDRFGRETAEDHRMHRPDPRAGQHGEGAFGHHRHIDRDPVALFDAHSLERVRHLDDLALQIGIGDLARIAFRIVGLEDQRDRIAMAVLDMAIDGAVADVEPAIGKPLDSDRIERPVRDGRRFGDPVEPLGLFGPEPVRILQAARIERVIFGFGAPRRRDRRFGPLHPFRLIRHRSLHRVIFSASGRGNRNPLVGSSTG